MFAFLHYYIYFLTLARYGILSIYVGLNMEHLPCEDFLSRKERELLTLARYGIFEHFRGTEHGILTL